MRWGQGQLGSIKFPGIAVALWSWEEFRERMDPTAPQQCVLDGVLLKRPVPGSSCRVQAASGWGKCGRGEGPSTAGRADANSEEKPPRTGTGSATHVVSKSHFFSCLSTLASSHLFVFDASLRRATPEKWEIILCTQLRFGPSRLILNLRFSNDFIREQRKRMTRSSNILCCYLVNTQADLHINDISRTSLSWLYQKDDF